MGCGGAKAAQTNDQQKSAGQPQAKPKSGGKDMPTKDNVKAGGINHAAFIMENTGKIMEAYDMEKKKLGEGSYGSVCKAKKKDTAQIRAVKTIPKGTMKNMDRFKQEIAIMKMMDHPNIIKLYETFEDHRNIYLVMELCTGGELFDRIIEAGHFTEVQAAILIRQIIQAIYFMHEAKVCHRDLKPENFLFVEKKKIEDSPIKIIDFGLSCKFTPGQVLTTKAGTPYYVAPQVLAGKYDQLSDLWSVGVIMYVMLCGYPPFFGETDAEVLSKVRLGNFSFNAADWKNVSEDAKNLIRMLLKMNPRDRFNAEQALNHDWVKNKAPKAVNVNLQQGFVDNLKGFRSANKFKKAALHVIASQLDGPKIKELQKVFASLDVNSDGTITVKEMKEGLERAKKDKVIDEIPADLETIMKEVDADGSGVIDYTEFLAATIQQRDYETKEVVWAAFRVFDKNGDGKISQEELKQVVADDDVKNAAGVQALAEIMQQVDTNGDGVIDFDEFCSMMSGKND